MIRGFRSPTDTCQSQDMICAGSDDSRTASKQDEPPHLASAWGLCISPSAQRLAEPVVEHRFVVEHLPIIPDYEEGRLQQQRHVFCLEKCEHGGPARDCCGSQVVRCECRQEKSRDLP